MIDFSDNLNEVQPWEQQPNEPDNAFDAFTYFRDLKRSDRTIIRAYRMVTNSERDKPSNTWMRWAHDYDWAGRARLYDRWMDRAMMESRRNAYAEKGAEHGRDLAQADIVLVDTLVDSYSMLSAWAPLVENNPTPANYVQLVGKIGELAKGAHSMKGPKSPGDDDVLDGLTDEELAEADRIATGQGDNELWEASDLAPPK